MEGGGRAASSGGQGVRLVGAKRVDWGGRAVRGDDVAYVNSVTLFGQNLSVRALFFICSLTPFPRRDIASDAHSVHT